jgi:hypothetical protein
VAVPVVTLTPPPAPPGGALARPGPPRAEPVARVDTAVSTSEGAHEGKAGHLTATASLNRVRDRRRAVNGFVRGGAVLTAAGILLVLLGVPHPATGLAPLGSGTGISVLPAYVPLVVVAVLVAAALAFVGAWTRDAIEAGPALTVTAMAGIGVLALAAMAAGRLGYDAAGDVLPAVSLIVAGGASILVAALVGALIRE